MAIVITKCTSCNKDVEQEIDTSEVKRIGRYIEYGTTCEACELLNKNDDFDASLQAPAFPHIGSSKKFYGPAITSLMKGCVPTGSIVEIGHDVIKLPLPSIPVSDLEASRYMLDKLMNLTIDNATLNYPIFKKEKPMPRSKWLTMWDRLHESVNGDKTSYGKNELLKLMNDIERQVVREHEEETED